MRNLCDLRGLLFYANLNVAFVQIPAHICRTGNLCEYRGLIYGVFSNCLESQISFRTYCMRDLYDLHVLLFGAKILTYERAQIVHLPQKLCRNSGYILRAREGLGAIRLSSYSVCGAHVTLYRDIISIRLVLNCAASPMRSVICNRD
ncbi:unnamed protein product [Trichogramma brassicae]|uniref:Uncharacterized protein n=1 Tax=Trichogramma brassicae TaxID=86971 RepID=A0A6H5J5U2_9HYME|nr:unnamed protein product [Trichogramma brassicae]